MTLSTLTPYPAASEPEKGTIAERLARIDKFVVPGYVGNDDAACITVRSIAGSPFARVELHYGRRYQRQHVGIDGLQDARLTDLSHILLDEVEAALGIFAPATMDAEVAA